MNVMTKDQPKKAADIKMEDVSEELKIPGLFTETKQEQPHSDKSVDNSEANSPENVQDDVPTKENTPKSGWIAAALAVALVGWMGSGFIIPAEEELKVVPARLQNAKVKLVRVETMNSTAQKVTQYLVSEGQALPNRLTQVRAEAPGNVEKLNVSKGAFVKKGDIIALLGKEDRSARQQQAQAELTRRQRDFDAIESLSKRGFSTLARLEEARAELVKAQAQVAAVSESLDDTVIRAPFSGVLNDLTIELGEYVAGGKDIGLIVDVDPLIVEIQVPQQSVGKLEAGKTAEIAFITGEKREGSIRYVSTNAKTATRTFTVEIEVQNTKHDIPAGISAQIRIPTLEVEAHFVSPAVLSLGSDGTLGVKTVTDEQKVRFFPIELVRAETKGIWVNGLPATTRIITIGQGFVSEGENVEASDRKVAAN